MAGEMGTGSSAPLGGVVVLDASRMLPGAVLARQLLDLGARLIKIEDPAGGDPFRYTPPLVGEYGAGFAVMYRGAESVGLDLRQPEDAARLRKLVKSADVIVESFRPGVMEGWGLGPERLRALNPNLIYCSLSSFGRSGPWADRVGHDLNFVALAGLLPLLGGEVPPIQLADVTAGLLAASSVLAALLQRRKTGSGYSIEQPLALAPLPFVTWAWADAAAGGESILETALAGRCPCYRTYRCGDGERIALGALEPKFWTAFVEVLGLPHLAGAGFETGRAGEETGEAVERVLAEKPRREWLDLFVERGLPVSPVNDLEAARAEAYFDHGGFLEEIGGAPGGPKAPGPFLPSVGRTPSPPAPSLGEHTEAVLEEFGCQRR